MNEHPTPGHARSGVWRRSMADLYPPGLHCREPSGGENSRHPAEDAPRAGRLRPAACWLRPPAGVRPRCPQVSWLAWTGPTLLLRSRLAPGSLQARGLAWPGLGPAVLSLCSMPGPASQPLSASEQPWGSCDAALAQSHHLSTADRFTRMDFGLKRRSHQL